VFFENYFLVDGTRVKRSSPQGDFLCLSTTSTVTEDKTVIDIE